MSGMTGRKLAVALLSLLLVLNSSSCMYSGASKHPGWKMATSGEQLVNLFWQDVKAKKWDSVAAHLAPIMVAMNSSAVLDRAATLEHLKSIQLSAFQIGEVKSEPAGADLIVTYVISATGRVGGNPLPSSPIRMMSVWQQVRGDYVLVAHTSVVAAQ